MLPRPAPGMPIASIRRRTTSASAIVSSALTAIRHKPTKPQGSTGWRWASPSINSISRPTLRRTLERESRSAAVIPLLSGGCHCGSITVLFESNLAPDQIGVRADQCSFCRKHGARTITDPKGRVKITVRAADDLIRYRFGRKTADYLVCGRCGVYVAAVLTEEGSSYATVNINTVESSERFTQPPVPSATTARRRRSAERGRRQKWTPAVVMIEEGAPPA